MVLLRKLAVLGRRWTYVQKTQLFTPWVLLGDHVEEGYARAEGCGSHDQHMDILLIMRQEAGGRHEWGGLSQEGPRGSCLVPLHFSRLSSELTSLETSLEQGILLLCPVTAHILQVQRLQDVEKVCLAVSQDSRGPYGPCAQLPPHQPATRGHLAPILLRSTLLPWAQPGVPPGPGRECEAFHLPRRLPPPQGPHLPWQCSGLACSFPHCHQIACLTAQMGSPRRTFPGDAGR
ncbi:unnamed protein product [Rangifer tarandus platyrhynchus]|uniref:Uncharacterized protein n=3 Tax=Rangifer tarandus platyrhynchus TaxID=3082113 RepID=A0AC59YPG6_RANTA|nr:unnamed protein product [Rangifer tarandus platyrhynchus]CAI9700321.1 unnamed protein product [Rangifer tarandus platyrhynchus]